MMMLVMIIFLTIPIFNAFKVNAYFSQSIVVGVIALTEMSLLSK
jgi:hypothetical protein